MARRYNEPIAELEPLENLYSFRQEAEVLVFLEKYPYLLPTLVTASEKIKFYFQDAKLWLGIIIDPDTSRHSHLVIWIETAFAPSEALKKLDQLVEEWWLKLPNRILDKISTNLEFV